MPTLGSFKNYANAGEIEFLEKKICEFVSKCRLQLPREEVSSLLHVRARVVELVSEQDTVLVEMLLASFALWR